MATDRRRLLNALRDIEPFIEGGLTKRIAKLEKAIEGCDGNSCLLKGVQAGITSEVLSAAYAVKRAAGQINVLIHAVGILLLIPKILDPYERIEYVSLGAGNAGRPFDLETDRRIAEFKFIHWTGGAETIRQNALFKDFYLLAEAKTKKRKELFVLDTSHPLKFLGGGRSLDNVLNKNATLAAAFRRQYGSRFKKVREYYQAKQHIVAVRDAAELLPELAVVAEVVELAEEKAASL